MSTKMLGGIRGKGKYSGYLWPVLKSRDSFDASVNKMRTDKHKVSICIKKYILLKTKLIWMRNNMRRQSCKSPLSRNQLQS